MLRNGPAFVPFNLILLDPPYNQRPASVASRTRAMVSNDGADPYRDVLATAESLLAADGRVVLEHARRQATPETAGRLLRVRLLESGDSSLSFYSWQP
jgi:16S rRNA G966 N2-methylase RsmD